MKTSPPLEYPPPYCERWGERASRQTGAPCCCCQASPSKKSQFPSQKGIHCERRGSVITGARQGMSFLLDDGAF